MYTDVHDCAQMYYSNQLLSEMFGSWCLWSRARWSGEFIRSAVGGALLSGFNNMEMISQSNTSASRTVYKTLSNNKQEIEMLFKEIRLFNFTQI